MYKKILFSLSILYLTGCTVAKPVVLNASYKQLNQVKKAYTGTNTRNGTNQILLIDDIYSRYTSPGEIDYTLYFQIYATPLNNPLNFDYQIINQSGEYLNCRCSLPFNIKASMQILADNGSWFTYSQAMTLNNNVKNELIYNAYHLPYDAQTRQNVSNGTYIWAYTIDSVFDLYLSGSGSMYIEPNQIFNHKRASYMIYNEIYLRDVSKTEILNAKTKSWSEPYLFFDWANEFDYENFPEVFAWVIDELKNEFDISQSFERKQISFSYDASISEELTAFNDGYNAGIDEGTSGVGTTRVQQVFRAIQSFLNIDFGFFRLAHVLGGMLVIAIVIFIVRRFR